MPKNRKLFAKKRGAAMTYDKAIFQGSAFVSQHALGAKEMRGQARPPGNYFVIKNLLKKYVFFRYNTLSLTGRTEKGISPAG